MTAVIIARMDQMKLYAVSVVSRTVDYCQRHHVFCQHQTTAQSDAISVQVVQKPTRGRDRPGIFLPSYEDEMTPEADVNESGVDFFLNEKRDSCESIPEIVNCGFPVPLILLGVQWFAAMHP